MLDFAFFGLFHEALIVSPFAFSDDAPETLNQRAARQETGIIYTSCSRNSNRLFGLLKLEAVNRSMGL